jgi:hypothetical protein
MFGSVVGERLAGYDASYDAMMNRTHRNVFVKLDLTSKVRSTTQTRLDDVGGVEIFK